MAEMWFSVEWRYPDDDPDSKVKTTDIPAKNSEDAIEQLLSTNTDAVVEGAWRTRR